MSSPQAPTPATPSPRRAAPAGRPGRYNRSAVGLVTSLAVTVVAIGGVLYFMGAFRNDYQRPTDSVDYRATVAEIQESGRSVPYPAELPSGWTSTGVDVPTEVDGAYMLRLLTEDGRFVGVREEDASPLSLARRWVDEDAETIRGYTVPASVGAPLAREWKGFADGGGDSAYAAEVGGRSIIVFGSAPRADLRRVVASLTTAPVG